MTDFYSQPPIKEDRGGAKPERPGDLTKTVDDPNVAQGAQVAPILPAEAAVTPSGTSDHERIVMHAPGVGDRVNPEEPMVAPSPVVRHSETPALQVASPGATETATPIPTQSTNPAQPIGPATAVPGVAEEVPSQVPQSSEKAYHEHGGLRLEDTAEAASLELTRYGKDSTTIPTSQESKPTSEEGIVNPNI